MNSTQDKINGAANTAAGTVKKVVGKVTGDEQMQEDATAQKTRGEAQKATGHLKDALKQGLHATGDVLEAAGKKLQNAALLKTLGEAVHKAGDKIEHLAD